MTRYEAVCRFFKSQKPPQTPPPPEYARRHHHSSLIDEAEEEMAALRWPELMTAGGLAGVMAWLVSDDKSSVVDGEMTWIVRSRSLLMCSRRGCRVHNGPIPTRPPRHFPLPATPSIPTRPVCVVYPHIRSVELRRRQSRMKVGGSCLQDWDQR